MKGMHQVVGDEGAVFEGSYEKCVWFLFNKISERNQDYYDIKSVESGRFVSIVYPRIGAVRRITTTTRVFRSK